MIVGGEIDRNIHQSTFMWMKGGGNCDDKRTGDGDNVGRIDRSIHQYTLYG